MSKHYFASDGSYGDGEDILVIDTDQWTDEDWQEVEEATDLYRREVAHDISLKYVDDAPTYKIVRNYRDFSRASKVILTGLTLEEAQAHCRRDDTRGEGWVDGYDEE